jgi:hypothetical protein
MTLAARIASLVRTLAFDLTPLRVSRDYRLVTIASPCRFWAAWSRMSPCRIPDGALTHLDAGGRTARRRGADSAARHGARRRRTRRRHDRRRLVLLAETGMALGCLLLGPNARGASERAGALRAGGVHGRTRRPPPAGARGAFTAAVGRDLIAAAAALQAFAATSE